MRDPSLRLASSASRPTFGGLDNRILSRRHPPSTRAQAPYRVDGGRHRATILLIDNYDSFTFNLAQAFQIIGATVEVFRNDAIDVQQAEALDPTHLVISPGPGNPDDAGVSLQMIEHFLGKRPILGVCLGHQSLVQVLGGRIVRAEALMHGKSSPATHDGRTLYTGLPNPLEVGRYHSLVAEPASLPDVLEVTCRTADGVIMGVRHREHHAEGVQFHPESVLTPDGDALLANFLEQS